MANTKKPARKGGAKKCAPKKAAQPKKKLMLGKQVVFVPESASQSIASAGEFETPKHPTVEEQFTANEEMRGTTYRWLGEERASRPKKPTRWQRFRSAITGLFVSKKVADANPDTTVRERVT